MSVSTDLTEGADTALVPSRQAPLQLLGVMGSFRSETEAGWALHQSRSFVEVLLCHSLSIPQGLKV